MWVTAFFDFGKTMSLSDAPPVDECRSIRMIAA